MRSLIRTLVDGFSEDLGRPASLQRALVEHSDLRAELIPPASCIASSSVVHWHELGTHDVFSWPRRARGQLLGWAASGSYYDSFQLERPEYAQLGREDLIDGWSCDITELHGFSSSKSDLRKFMSTDAMVEANSRRLIAEISHARLAENLAHKGIRIINHEETSDHFTRYQWDGRLWLMNTDGSHHLAAAKYIAARLGVMVPLRARLYVYWLNEGPLASLGRDFEMFLISSAAAASNAFHDAMRAFRATWLWHPMPRPYDGTTRAVLLPKSEGRSRRVAHELRRAGLVDLGSMLARLVAGQAQAAV